MPDDIKPNPNLENVEDDDPNAPDDDTPVTPQRVARAMKDADPDDEDDEEEPEAEPEPDAKGAKPAKAGAAAKPPEGEGEAAAETTPADGDKTAPPAKPAEKLLNQEQVNKLVQARIARERETYEKQVLSATGKTLEQLKAETREQRVKDLQYEKGFDEEMARDVADKEARLRELEANEKETARELELAKANRAYQEQRTAWLNDPQRPPKVRALAQQFASEIDQFADNGAEVPWDFAAPFVIGQKVLSGALLESVEQATEQRTLANVAKRGKVSPEGTATAPDAGVVLTSREQAIAKAMGVTPERYAAQKAKLQPHRRAR